MAAILPEIDIPGIVDLLQESLNSTFMRLAGGANELIRRKPQPRPRLLEDAADPIGIGLRGLTGLCSRLDDLVAVLVGPGEEIDLLSPQPKPLEADHRVGQDGGVGVSQMRGGVDVIDRRRQVEGLVTHESLRSGAGPTAQPPLLQPPPPQPLRGAFSSKGGPM